MKKTSKIVAVVLAALLVVAAVAVLASCGTDYIGEYSYETQYGTYGAKVTVTVNNGVITAVKLWTDEQTGWVRTTKSWKSAEEDSENGVGLGYTATEAAYAEWIENTFVGKTVEEVLAIQATHTPATDGGYDSFVISTESAKLAGATQSAVRVILAVQDALKSFKTAA